MGRFKQFLTENEDLLQKILEELNELSVDEVDELGAVLYEEFFEEEESIDESEYFGIEDITEMIEALGTEMYEYILDLIEDEECDEESDDLEEGMARVMKKSNMNKKKRKFMTKSAAEMRKTKSVRKKENRKKLAKTKRNYRANKMKIKSYQASRTAAIKKGKHTTKIRKVAG